MKGEKKKSLAAQHAIQNVPFHSLDGEGKCARRERSVTVPVFRSTLVGYRRCIATFNVARLMSVTHLGRKVQTAQVR